MKTIFYVIIMFAGLLFSQTSKQIEQAREVIQRTGMSEAQVREAAKAKGFTNKQIDNAIQKEKVNKIGSGQSVLELSENIEVPELEKSNEIIQQQPKSKTMQEELPIVVEDDLEIIKEVMEEEVLSQNLTVDFNLLKATETEPWDQWAMDIKEK